MSDPLTSAILSLFQVRIRNAAQCDPPSGGTTNCAGPFGFNLGNINMGGMQVNSAGVGKPGKSGTSRRG